jgi:hypothetical protein
MANTVLMPSIIAAESLLLLDNALVMANQVYREYEGEYMKSYNGYKPGDTITIRRPTDFTVRVGAVATTQDVVEGSTNIVVNQQIGIDFKFTSADLTLKIEEMSERILTPDLIYVEDRRRPTRFAANLGPKAPHELGDGHWRSAACRRQIRYNLLTTFAQ